MPTDVIAHTVLQVSDAERPNYFRDDAPKADVTVTKSIVVDKNLAVTTKSNALTWHPRVYTKVPREVSPKS